MDTDAHFPSMFDSLQYLLHLLLIQQARLPCLQLPQTYGTKARSLKVDYGVGQSSQHLPDLAVFALTEEKAQHCAAALAGFWCWCR
jgi:hypothetical protein